MKIYNTASRTVEDFMPIEAGKLKLYTCGPTVYDYAQIGNLRAFVFDDTLRRAAQTLGYDVKHVMNITDVGHLVSDEDEGEDKLETGAAREQKTVWQVAEFYTQAFLTDARQLNILPPNGYHGPHGAYARATDFITQQIELIKLLIDKGFAYITQQAIYFDVSKLADYGRLTRQKLSDKEVAARSDVITDKSKRNPQDFAIWFFLTGRFARHSMHWDSPWGQGFPGWHLECSAIIHATLGEPIDIHTGGVDHVGTHHTNEIAQSEAAYGTKLANYWMHNEHLLVDGKKMSKSKGNYFTLADVVSRGIHPLALRLLFLQSHYRNQMNFSWESLDSASKNLKNLQALADLRFQAKPEANPEGTDYFSDLRVAILDDLSNDLATPAVLAKLIKAADDMMERGVNPASLEQFTDFLKFIDGILGLGLLESSDISEPQKELITRREAARQDQDWQAADEMREHLSDQGIELNDTPHGAIWRRS